MTADSAATNAITTVELVEVLRAIQASQVKLETEQVRLTHRLGLWMSQQDSIAFGKTHSHANALMHERPSTGTLPASSTRGMTTMCSGDSGIVIESIGVPSSTSALHGIKPVLAEDQELCEEDDTFSICGVSSPSSGKGRRAFTFDSHSEAIKSFLLYKNGGTTSSAPASMPARKNIEEAPTRWTIKSTLDWVSSGSNGNRRPKTKLQLLVTSSTFTIFVSFLVILNSVFILAEVDYRALHGDARLPKLFKGTHVVFFVAFVVEFALRLTAFKSEFFLGREYQWNLFDLVMVALALVEVGDSLIDQCPFRARSRRLFELVRMIRVIRIFRVLRFCPQLRIIIGMILESVKSAGWLVFLVLTFLYMFGVAFTSGAQEYMLAGTTRAHYDEIKRFYGTVFRSMSTCFQSMSGGLDWGEAMSALGHMDMGGLYVCIFLLFIVFSIMCFMNVVTGVFVDSAIEKSKSDREMIIQKHLNQKKAYVENLREIFQDSDTDDSGTISLQEFKDYMLGVDTSDISKLFAVLDKDGNGEIEFDEFVEALEHVMRCQSTDQVAQKVLQQTKRNERDLLQMKEFMESAVESMKLSMKAVGCSSGRDTTSPGRACSPTIMPRRLSTSSNSSCGPGPKSSGRALIPVARRLSTSSNSSCGPGWGTPAKPGLAPERSKTGFSL